MSFSIACTGRRGLFSLIFMNLYFVCSALNIASDERKLESRLSK